MANSFKHKTYFIDTPGATPVTTSPLRVKSVQWITEAGIAGQNAIITGTDAVSPETLWEDVCPGANFNSNSLVEEWWMGGFTVPTLESGHLLIQLC